MIPTSLLKLGGESAGRAVKMFAGIQKYMSDDIPLDPASSPSKSARIELVQKLLHQVGMAPVPCVQPPCTLATVLRRACASLCA